MEDHEAFVSLGEIYEADRHRQVWSVHVGLSLFFFVRGTRRLSVELFLMQKTAFVEVFPFPFKKSRSVRGRSYDGGSSTFLAWYVQNK